MRDLIAIALGLKTEPVPLNHMAGTFHIETDEGTYRGRFLAPVTMKLKDHAEIPVRPNRMIGSLP